MGRHDEGSALVPVGIGEIAVARPPERLYTVLGSCVGVLVHEPRSRVGGIAHIMLPSGGGNGAMPGKYADTGVPELVRRVREAAGGARHLTVKIAGGANMFARVTGEGGLKIGARNEQAVGEALERLGLRIAARDVGGAKGRKVILDTATGNVIVSTLEGEGRPL